MKAFEAAHDNLSSMLLDDSFYKKSNTPARVRWPLLRLGAVGDEMVLGRQRGHDEWDDEDLSYDENHVSFKSIFPKDLIPGVVISLVFDNRMAAAHGEWEGSARFLHHHHSAVECLIQQRKPFGVEPWRWDRKVNPAYRVGLKLNGDARTGSFHEKSFILTGAIVAILDAANEFASWYASQKTTTDQTSTFKAL